jgi:alpha-glucoside transport system substrate-binding protein
MKSGMRSRAGRLIVALGITVAACGCGGQPSAGPLTILVPWQGKQLSVFKSIVQGFARDKFTVQVDSTRGLTNVLAADLRQGNQPDMADLPSIGAVREYAADGYLKPLAGIRPGNYGPLWLGLMRVRPGLSIYAVPFKIDVKSLIWYDPTMLNGRPYAVPRSWAQLTALSRNIQDAGGTPWCVPLASAPVSGWPGTDWIADILLRTDGPAIYQQWVDGTLSWTSPLVRSAWQEWGQLTGISDSRLNVAQASLNSSVGQLTPKPGGCYLKHGTLFDFADTAVKFTQEFVKFPSAAGTLQVSADFLVRFSHSQHAQDLISYLTSPRVQLRWAARAKGFSANQNVPPARYGRGPRGQIARLVADAPELCLGADDAMRPDLSMAFDEAVWRYVAQPGNLPAILPVLQTVSTHLPPRTGRAGLSALKVCGAP